MKRFGLFSTFCWIAIAAVLSAAFFHARVNELHLQAEFSAMPHDETKLKAWLTEQNWSNVAVRRTDKSVHLRAHTNFFQDRIPKPPWKELGYEWNGAFSRGRSESPYLFLDAFIYVAALIVVLGSLKITARWCGRQSATSQRDPSFGSEPVRTTPANGTTNAG